MPPCDQNLLDDIDRLKAIVSHLQEAKDRARRIVRFPRNAESIVEACDNEIARSEHLLGLIDVKQGVDMPTHDGKKLVSESMSRKKNQCYVNVRLEIELSEGVMKSLPNWHNDAIDFMRGYVQDCSSLEDFATSLPYADGVTVTHTDIQVMK